MPPAADAPEIDLAQPRLSADELALLAPPQQVQPSERPKLVLETPRRPEGQPSGTGRFAVPASPVAAMGEKPPDMRATRGLVVNDFGGLEAGVGGTLTGPGRGASGGSLELLSDSKGVDFSSYLKQILARVKRNWLAIIPDSVSRGGRSGRVAIQFSLSRNGQVPKLVIASTSGNDALDRAAVAGISASIPFPPPPATFDGSEIRLQLVFTYNMRTK
jgi:TonB family protein